MTQEEMIKILKSIELVSPYHIEMTSNGHGEFPDGYKLTDKGIEYIINKIHNEKDKLGN